MSQVAEESFANIRTVKAFSNEAEEALKFVKGNSETYDMSLVKAKYNAVLGFGVAVLIYGAMAVVMWYAGTLQAEGCLTTGEFSSFLFYMLMLVMNFAMLSMLFPQGMSMIGASDKVVALMDYLPEINTTGGI
jgi:ATP-binding cassette, subfamily B, bacterial MsbA